MSIQWPWVSRRYAVFLEESLQRMRDERDAAMRRADRAIDQLIAATGRVPISDEGHTEMLTATEESLDANLANLFGEDEGDFSFPRVAPPANA